jgi:hypothetical protein
LNQYEKYLKDKLQDAEEKIEHLYYQISITMANNASMTVMNADLYTKRLELEEENKALRIDIHNAECNLQLMTDLSAQLKEALAIFMHNKNKYKGDGYHDFTLHDAEYTRIKEFHVKLTKESEDKV